MSDNRKKNRIPWIICVCAALLGCVIIYQGLFRNKPIDEPDPINGTIFMSYEGPIFPLTSMDDTDGIEVKREVNFDFSPSASEIKRGSLIQDRYILTNTTDQDKTLTVLYPYTSSFQDGLNPQITVNEENIEPTLYSGMYVVNLKDKESLTLSEISYWEEYKTLLEDGTYMHDALNAYPELNELVYVYEFTNITDGGSDADAPTLNMEFSIDFDKTSVLTYGFNGGRNDSEAGEIERSFFISEAEDDYFDQKRYLIVIGEDIESYQVQAYKNGGCYEGQELEGAGADVTRYETTLMDVLKKITTEDYRVLINDFKDNEIFSEDVFYNEMCRAYAFYNQNGNDLTERYMGMLEEIITEVFCYERIMVQSFEVTIPAGGSISISAELVKRGSFDFGGSGSKNQGLRGYDMVTLLGSTFTFNSQSASFSNLDGIKLVRDNFGLDGNKNVTQIDLDIDKEHYYIEVRAVE